MLLALVVFALAVSSVTAQQGFGVLPITSAAANIKALTRGAAAISSLVSNDESTLIYLANAQNTGARL